MAQFTTYQSQRIGGSGPNSGLQYNVDAWFPDVASASINEDIFQDLNRERVILRIRVLAVVGATAGDKSMYFRSKKVGQNTSILNPGVELFRILVPNTVTSSTAGLFQYQGVTKPAQLGSSMQWYINDRFYMDKTMDLNITMNEFTSQSLQIHYLTGDPERLMEAMITK